ncbi:hypothetical protein LTR37_012156 [Vermiconidia calcicola]|uniref:Uncharacterized protein n=1 Tax=Vermiconidia calcicola TaxID=1690605 RepID=A0ACC3MZX0_9PEZI|nr:hypothetical protein LTR37_012156 [Vermiconidia calcicola]
MASNIPHSYGLLLFPGFEVLDAAGPIEVLNILSKYLSHSEMNLSVIAETVDDLVTPGPFAPGDENSKQFTGQQLYQPTHSFATAPKDLDVLIIPGGRGVNRTDEELKPLLSFLRHCYHGTDGRKPLQYIFSICTGSALLARTGILDGQTATTNKKAWDRVTPLGPKTHWVAKARWVESNGRVWTASGVTAGIDGMAALVGSVYGEETAERVCEFIEHVRVKEAGDDPFAEVNGCRDVLPVE